MTIEELKYPIGKFTPKEKISAEEIQEYISVLEKFPQDIREVVEKLSDKQLDTPYREGGWTVRQLVNHIADSHMNSLIRFKWALTEDNPTIKAYSQDGWANLADSKSIPIEPALKMIEGVHARLVSLLKSMSQEDFKKTFVHPEKGRQLTLEHNLGLYAWHSKHHLAHIHNLAKRKDW